MFTGAAARKASGAREADRGCWYSAAKHRATRCPPGPPVWFELRPRSQEPGKPTTVSKSALAFTLNSNAPPRCYSYLGADDGACAYDRSDAGPKAFSAI